MELRKKTKSTPETLLFFMTVYPHPPPPCLLLVIQLLLSKIHYLETWLSGTKPKPPTTPAITHISHPLKLLNHYLYSSRRWQSCIFNLDQICRFITELSRIWIGSVLIGSSQASFLVSFQGENLYRDFHKAALRQCLFLMNLMHWMNLPPNVEKKLASIDGCW